MSASWAAGPVSQVTDGPLVESPAAQRGDLAMEAIGLSKDYRLKGGDVLPAVRDVTFNLYRGAVIALVGESGSGKSTVAKLLAGQEPMTSGRVTLNGQPVGYLSRREFRRYKSEVQLVFQDPFSSLNPVHTVRYHVSRPILLHQLGSPRALGEEVKRKLQDELVSLMDQVRLTPAEHFLAKYPHELSGGQRQRVSFARALAARPTVLLADEPVSMLDVSIRLEMLSLLDDLRQRFRLALLYITHDIASARYFADEILVMYAGQVIERGPAEEVTQQPAHPYTQLLVASAPDPDNLGSILRSGGKRAARQQDVQARIVNACPFHPRCPLAEDRCRSQKPPFVTISRQRGAACWRLDVAAPKLMGGALAPAAGTVAQDASG